MSKAKELATNVLDNIEAGRSEWQEFRKTVWDLCDAVLSEPEPDLKGLEYQILESDDSEDLTKIVNYAISDGWKPSGSLVVVFAHMTRYEVNEIYFKYAQSMIREAS